MSAQMNNNNGSTAILTPIEPKFECDMPRGIKVDGSEQDYALEFLETTQLRSGGCSSRDDAGIANEAALASVRELAKSIAAAGMIEPVIVRAGQCGDFEVIAGERRVQAARLLGLLRVPCLVRTCSRSSALVLSLAENLQRRDLNPIEKARGLRRLLDECKLTQEEIGQRIGLSQSAIAHHLRLLDLPQEVQSLLRDGTLSLGHGKALAGVGKDRRVIDLAYKCVSDGVSVRALEELVARTRAADRALAHASSSRTRIERELPNGVFLVIKESASQPSSGTVEIPYYSKDELDWVIRVLCAGDQAIADAAAETGRKRAVNGVVQPIDSFGRKS